MTAHRDELILLPPSEGKAAGGRGRWRPASGAFGSLAPMRAQVADALGGVEGARTLPAHERFTGVVWQHLAPSSLDRDAVKRIVVVSALGGLFAGTDPVPDHRLKLTARVGELGRLDRFWKPAVTAALARRAGRRTVWDLLPNEHAAALDLEAVRGRVIHVRFVSADGARAMGHFAKAAKGAFARAVLVDGAAAVELFDAGGWRARWTGDTVEVRSPTE